MLFFSAPLSRLLHTAEVRTPYDGLRLWSAITHGLGAVLALLASIVMLLRCAQPERLPFLVLFAIYGGSMVCLYTASTLYHCLRLPPRGRLILRKCDHCSIYLLIAGSYTPICGTVLRGPIGTTLLTIIWLMAGAGIVLTLFCPNLPRWLSSILYLVMGWAAIAALYPLSQVLTKYQLFLLLLGGILYTIGGILYAVKWPGRDHPTFGFHEIFHIFILLGSAAHFLLMLQILASL